MGSAVERITADIQAFLLAQPVFFVATAPLGRDGHINLSPKGLDTFRILSPTRVAYLDLTGSGNETAAHLLENGRLTFMFCAFDGAPRIVRLHGTGRVIPRASGEWPDLASLFPEFHGTRQVIVAEIRRVQTSCGFAVPRMRLEEARDTLESWARRKGNEGLREYRAAKNTRSIDGLPTPPTD